MPAQCKKGVPGRSIIRERKESMTKDAKTGVRFLHLRPSIASIFFRARSCLFLSTFSILLFHFEREAAAAVTAVAAAAATETLRKSYCLRQIAREVLETEFRTIKKRANLKKLWKFIVLQNFC